MFHVNALTKSYFFGPILIFWLLANWQHLWTESIQVCCSVSALLLVFFPIQAHTRHISLLDFPSIPLKSSCCTVQIDGAALESMPVWSAEPIIEIDGKDFAIHPSSFSIIAHPALRVTECWGPSHLSWVWRWGSRHPGRVATIHRRGNAARQTTICSHFPTLESTV